MSLLAAESRAPFQAFVWWLSNRKRWQQQQVSAVIRTILKGVFARPSSVGGDGSNHFTSHFRAHLRARSAPAQKGFAWKKCDEDEEKASLPEQANRWPIIKKASRYY